jgi:hypothetical protein
MRKKKEESFSCKSEKPRPTKKDWFLFGPFLGLLAMSCPTHPNIKKPLFEDCLIGDASLACFDPRLPEDQQSYMKSFIESKNSRCTNLNDSEALEDSWNDLAGKFTLLCERHPRDPECRP